MFVGHYSVAFACRTERNGIPVWVLFIAVQFLDYISATLVLLGIEKLHVIKGFTAGSMLDSHFHPYSHSLITAILWSVVAELIYKGIWGRHGRHYSKSAPLRGDYALFEKQLPSRRRHFMNSTILQNQFDDLEEPRADEHVLTVTLGRTPGEIVDEIELRLARSA